MAQEKLEDLSIEMLKKRKKTTKFFIVLMAVTILLNIGLMVFTFVRDGKINFGVYIPTGFVPILFLIIFNNGLKKINIELERRETTK